MRFLGVFRKAMWEQRRDLLILSLTLLLGPCFVLLYALFFPTGSTTYGVLIWNQDTAGDGNALIERLRQVAYSDGQPLLVVNQVNSRAEAENPLRDRDAEVLLVIPPDFSQTLQAARAGQQAAAGTPVMFVGDLTNPYYAVAAIMANAALDQYIQETTGQARPVEIVEDALGASAARSEFETYVPGLLVLAVILLIYQSSMTITREIETGTLRRLQTTGMTALDFLGGTTAALTLTALLAVALTFLTALALGFRSQGPLWLAFLIAALTGVSIIGTGLIVACFARSGMQASIIANFPLALFMFFSGAAFPLPRVPLFSLGGRVIGLYDILPPTHAVAALNKVFTLGAELNDILYELIALVLLSALYFALGVWLFSRRHLRAA
ncbi:MAG: transport permease protein [Chloroflexota bacterium]|nr:MAG: transport permease protein [Chloroflexota bacterium]